MANIIFRKIYYRKFTDEYKIDFGEAPPKPEAKYFVNDWFFWESSEQE